MTDPIPRRSGVADNLRCEDEAFMLIDGSGCLLSRNGSIPLLERGSRNVLMRYRGDIL